MSTENCVLIIVAAFAVQGFVLATAVLHYWRRARGLEAAALDFAAAIYEEKKARGLTAEQARDEMLAEFCGAESTPDGQ